MAGGTWLKRLRGAVGNVLMWGATFFTGVLAVATTLRLTGLVDLSWTEALVAATRAGVAGGVAGGAFSSVVGLLHRGRRLTELSWIRFGLAGGIAAAVVVPLFLQAMNLLSGDGLVPWEFVLDDARLMAVFGGAAAAITVKLAQSADRALSDGGAAPLDGVDEPRGLPQASDPD